MDSTQNPAPAPSRERLLSLDAFRGLVIVLMFLVNVAGRDPAFPEWFAHRGYNDGRHGNGLADFVFPWFLFIVGCAVPFSMASGRAKGMPYWRRVLAALRRGVVLYLLGTLLWCASIGYDPKRMIDVSVFLHWDILPLIGFGYFAAVLVGSLPRGVRVGIVVALLLFKAASLTLIPHPEFGRVVWTNTHSYDQFLKSRLGWWGVLVTQGLAAASVVMLGALAVEYLRDQSRAIAERALRLAAWGTVLTAASYAAHRLALPYSKDFLTSSYTLLMAGTGAITLALLTYIIDVRKWTTLTWLRVYGMNAIAVYILAELMWKTAMVRWNMVTPWGEASMMVASMKAWLQHWAGAVLPEAGAKAAGSWLLVAGYIAFYWAVAAALHRAKMYIKV